MIEYELRRAKIKNVYLQIKEGKVIVKAPYGIEERRIQKMVERKKEWIKKNIDKSIQKEEKQDQYSQQEFIQLIKNTVSELVEITGLKPEKVRVKELQYAWGSCSRNRNISLNANLIKYSEEAIRYVILHELCHLNYMNHSKDFWKLVEQYMPNYKEIKKEFK